MIAPILVVPLHTLNDCTAVAPRYYHSTTCDVVIFPAVSVGAQLITRVVKAIRVSGNSEGFLLVRYYAPTP